MNNLPTIRHSYNDFSILFIEPNQLWRHHLGIEFLYSIVKDYDKNVVCDLLFYGMTESYFHQLSPDGFNIYCVSMASPIAIPNIIQMMQNCDIEIYTKERNSKILIMGGQGIINPEPLADIADVIVLGEGEDIITEILEAYNPNKDKNQFLTIISKISGVYIPSLYEPRYDENNNLKKYIPKRSAPKQILINYTKNINQYICTSILQHPTYSELDNKEIKEGKLVIDRGCIHNCHFCQYTSIKGKYRFIEFDQIKSAIDQLISEKVKNITLISASFTNHPDIIKIINYINKKGATPYFGSHRLDELDNSQIKQISYSQAKTRGITIAPESSERLRYKYDKKISDQKILEIINEIAANKIKIVKIFCIFGFPDETKQDRIEFTKLLIQISNILSQNKITMVVYPAPFLPHPFTPLQRKAAPDPWIYEKHIIKFKRRLLSKNINVTSSNGMHYSFKQASNIIIDDYAIFNYIYQLVFYRSDRRITKLLVDTYKNKQTFSSFLKACKDYEINIHEYFNEMKGALPWHHINLQKD